MSEAPKTNRVNSILSRDTDHAARPGFRNAPNQRSKAQKKEQAKKKKSKK